MKLTQFFKGMVCLTILSLIYINLQMQIFDLAYQGKKKEKEIRRLIDDNGKIFYDVLSLKSASNLGIKLLNEKSQLQFMDKDKIVKLETFEPSHTDKGMALSQKKERKLSILENLFSLKAQAEARSIE